MKARHIIEAFYGTPLMVIVHPGSLCGSYHTSHAFDPRKLRQLVDEIYGWNGHFAIIYGDFPDELDDYPEVGKAIDFAAWPNTTGEYTAGANSGELRRVARQIVREMKAASSPMVLITGAWGEEDGCARFVADELVRLGAKATLSKH